MLHRHLRFSGALHHQAGGHAHSSVPGPVRVGCSRHSRSCRRTLLLVQALDGRAEQTIINSVGSNASAGAVTTTEQQLSSTTQAEASSSSSSSASSSKHDTAAVLPHAAGTAADDSDAGAGHQQSATQQAWVPSWESWCEHFEQQDAHGTRLDALAAPLAAAVAAEDYATAAALKSEMDELVAADVVATVQKQLASALADERYAEAAALRDKGWALLEGWWACMSSQNPRGHLLRIYPEYGRWTGKAYSPRDLGELQGWSDDEPGHMLGRSSSGGGGSGRRQGAPGSSRRKAGGGGVAASLAAEGLAQLGTPLMEVFVRREGQGLADVTVGALQDSGSEQQWWSSQAVLLQPAGSAAAGAAAGAARDIGLEAEIGELFRSAVSAAVWGRSGLAGDTAAAAAANLANSSSSSSGKDSNIFSSLVRNVGDEGASPFASSSGARYELIIGENGQVLGTGTLAAAAGSDLEPWEELLNSAEPLLRSAAAAADMNGGALCADGVLRPVQRQQQHATPVLQLLLEVVEGSKSVLLAARAVTPPAVAGVTGSTGVTGSSTSSTGVTRGTAWVVADMPGGPVIVPDWSKVDPREVQDRQARIAASLEAQRIVRDMLGAQDNWWMTEFMGSWSPPATAAAAEPEQQQQQQGTLDPMDWQLPLQLLQQQELEEQQQQQQQEPCVQGHPPDQQSDMTLLETTEDDDDSWPALDAVSRAGFYAPFYQDYGPGVDAPSVRPAATAAYAGFEQQAAAAMDTAAAAAGGRFTGMSPADIEEALETLAELKDASQSSSGTTASSSTTGSSSSGDGGTPYPRWLPPDGVSRALEQQQQSRGSRRHTGPQAAASSSSSSLNWPPPTSAAAALGTAVGASGFGAEALPTGDELERHPAAITLHSRDRFTIRPSRQSIATAAAAAAEAGEAGSSSGSGAAEQQSSNRSSSTRPRRSLYVIEVPTCVMRSEQQQQQQQQQQHDGVSPPEQQQEGNSNGFFSPQGHEHGPVTAAAADSYSNIQSKGYSRMWQLAAHQVLLQHACSSSSSSEPLPITWRQPLADLMAARAAEVLWGAAVAVTSTLEEDAAADEHADSSSSNGGASSSSSLGVDEDAPLLVLQLPPELVDRTLAAIAGSGEAAAAKAAAAAVQVPKSPVVAAAAAAAAAGMAGIAAAIDPQEGLTYRRLQTKQHPTDHLQGLFLGSFGPHGPELLSLSRSICMDSGEELLVGLKLTGDPNVPAGEVSFRARVGRRHRRDARNVYPPQLEVTARYPGEGRVAGPNFTNPRWVEGELLVFNSSSSSSSSSSWTSGAQLGFVYSMPGEKRFLILLNRVALD